MKLFQLPNRLVAFVWGLGLLLFSVTLTLAQDKSAQRIVLKANTATVDALMAALEEQAGLNFVYSDISSELPKSVNIGAKEAGVQQILQQIADQTNLQVNLNGRNVMLKLAQRATLQGTVRDSNGQPLAYVSVAIRGKQSTQTDHEGRFTLKNIEAGSHTVTASYIGLKTQQKVMKFVDGQAAVLDFTFDDEALSLEETEVFGIRNQQPEKLDDITRLPLKPSDQIQSISIISDKLIRQQGTLTIRDAVQNVPGVYTFSTYGNTKESIASRGFRGIPTLKNGVRVYEDGLGQGFITDMEGVESIQVLKGSNAITQGLSADVGNSGGVVNIVTKTPKFENSGYVSMRAGSWGLARPAFDVQGLLSDDKKLGFRINGAYERRDSYRALVNGQKIYVNPSLAWRPDEKTKIILEMDYLNDSRTPDAGTVNLGDLGTDAIYNLPYSQYLGFENDRYTTKNMTYALRFNRELSNKLNLRVAYFGSTLRTNNQSVYLGTLRDMEANIRTRSVIGSTVENNNTALQIDLVGTEIATGPFTHTFQAGVDYKTALIKTYLPANNMLRIDTVDVQQALTNTLPVSARFNWNGTPVSDIHINSYGLLAQDVVSIGRYVKAVLGLRYSSSENESNGTYGTTRGSAWNPQLGLIIAPLNGFNVFGSYTSNTNINAAGIIDREGKPLGRSRYDQFEVGTKTEWLDNRLRFNLTLYKINNRNLPMQIYEGNIPTPFYEKGGNDERKGLEAELTGRLLPQLDIIAGYAYIDAKYKDHSLYYYNSAPLNTPKHTYNLYLNYMANRGMLEGLSIGAGVYYLGKRPISDWSRVVDEQHGIQPGQKPFDMKRITTVNVQTGYSFNRQWDLRIFVNNIFDKIGYNAYRSLYINQTDPRNVSAMLTYHF